MTFLQGLGWLDQIRRRGWSVAVHNDYKQNGESFTFWLFTCGDLAAKGEGRTDAEALEKVAAEIVRTLRTRGIGGDIGFERPRVVETVTTLTSHQAKALETKGTIPPVGDATDGTRCEECDAPYSCDDGCEPDGFCHSCAHRLAHQFKEGHEAVRDLARKLGVEVKACDCAPCMARLLERIVREVGRHSGE
jgi:hypothetical protein